MNKEVVFISGASRGIGTAIAKNFADLGHTVIGTSRSSFTFDTKDKNLIPISLDITNRESIAQCMNFLKENNFTPSVLINNAGITSDQLFLRMKDDEWDNVIATNLTGTFNLTRALIKGMIKNRYGRIINISSAHGLTASPYKSAYIAAKHGVIGLTKTTALETAEENITANAICPGYVLTPLVEAQIPDTMRKYDMSREEVIKKVMLERQPSRQFASVEQLGGTCVFFCSDAADQITRTTLSVDGGWTAL